MTTLAMKTNEAVTDAMLGGQSRSAVWCGRVLSGLAVAFMLFDGGIKLVPMSVVTETMAQIGWPATAEMARGLGLLALLCTALYSVPRTSLIGAILLTGYLGGAIATQLRVEAPLFSHVLFGIYLGLMIWGGLVLRDARVRAILLGR